jgi:hypothetical protein
VLTTRRSYSVQILKATAAIGKGVDGIITSVQLMLDKEAWRFRISMIVKAGKPSDSGRCRTRSDTVA